MVRIKIEVQAHDGEPKRPKLFQAFEKSHAYVYKVTESREAFYAIADNENADLILDPENQKYFGEVGLRALTPPEYTAARTVFVRGVDESIKVKSKENILREVNADQRYKIEEVVLLPSGRNLKLICDSVATADKLIKSGINIFRQKFTGKTLEKEVYVYRPLV